MQIYDIILLAINFGIWVIDYTEQILLIIIKDIFRGLYDLKIISMKKISQIKLKITCKMHDLDAFLSGDLLYLVK